MKTIKIVFTLVFASIMVFDCSKKDDDNGGSYPGVLKLYIDLKKSEDTSFEEGEVQFFQENEYNGEYIGGSQEWLVLEKNIYEYFGGESYFGPCIDYMFGWEEGDEPDQGSQW